MEIQQHNWPEIDVLFDENEITGNNFYLSFLDLKKMYKGVLKEWLRDKESWFYTQYGRKPSQKLITDFPEESDRPFLNSLTIDPNNSDGFLNGSSKNREILANEVKELIESNDPDFIADFLDLIIPRIFEQLSYSKTLKDLGQYNDLDLVPYDYSYSEEEFQRVYKEELLIDVVNHFGLLEFFDECFPKNNRSSVANVGLKNLKWLGTGKNLAELSIELHLKGYLDLDDSRKLFECFNLDINRTSFLEYMRFKKDDDGSWESDKLTTKRYERKFSQILPKD